MQQPPLLNPDDAIRKIVAAVEPVAGAESVPIIDALYRVAAEDVPCPMDVPPFTASAMDGYAVDTANFVGEPPYTLEIIDRSLAGHPASKSVIRGTAIRIFTGAMLPDGANAVVPQENTESDGNRVIFRDVPEAGRWVRPEGHDVTAGSTLLEAGTTFDAFSLSWLCACGIAKVTVKPRVRVAIFSTGDELAERGGPLKPGQIYESNRFALTALMHKLPVDVIDLGCIPDTRDATADALLTAAQSSDIIITSGGVSVGDTDYVKSVAEDIGELNFWKIALKPGKPLAVGKILDADFFGLPGNPVSTIVTYMLFVVPAIAIRSGGKFVPPTQFNATLETDIRHDKGRREYQRASLRIAGTRTLVSPTGDQSSNRLSTFQNADCLILIPETRGNLSSGEDVSIILLS